MFMLRLRKLSPQHQIKGIIFYLQHNNKEPSSSYDKTYTKPDMSTHWSPPKGRKQHTLIQKVPETT